jgi:predicted RNase H-like nuclease
MLFVGIDLAWDEGSPSKLANESGAVALESTGRVRDAGWTIGIEETLEWIESKALQDTTLFIDAPLIVNNAHGTQRACEREVSRCYMHPWKVGANSTHPGSPRLGGVRLLELLEAAGWRYSDGVEGPERTGRVVSECYPYTTIVGTEELNYDVRPTYKRPPRGMKVADWRPLRAAECDELIRRVAQLVSADPAMDLTSHPVTRQLVGEPSPLEDPAYKSREDLLDAALCAWTAALWSRRGKERCQVLGAGLPAAGRRATIIAPARPEQRPDGPDEL